MHAIARRTDRLQQVPHDVGRVRQLGSRKLTDLWACTGEREDHPRPDLAEQLVLDGQLATQPDRVVSRGDDRDQRIAVDEGARAEPDNRIA